MKRLAVCVGVVLTAAFFSGCSPEPTGTSGGLKLTDNPVEHYRMELLNLAFSGASEMPLRPHIKNRSRAQLQIVTACIELGQPTLAISYIDRIENWQHWQGYADLAYDLALNGHSEQSRMLIERMEPALRMAEDLRTGKIVASTPNPLIDTLSDWRYKSVLSRVMQARLLNGTLQSFEADEEVYGEENASVLLMSMLSDKAADFETTLNALRTVTADPNFEIVYQGLLEMADFADVHRARIHLSEFIAENIEPKLDQKMPVFMKISVLLRFARTAIENGDVPSAERLMDQADELIEPLKSSPRFYIPEKEKLVRMRLKAGQTEQAEAGWRSMIAAYREKEAVTVDIERAEILCGIAEVAHAMGDTAQSLEFYRQAVIQGQVNPNSRPRAEDLTRICCSMALQGVEPTAELWSALNEMKAGLGEPW